jgi:uncharacterized integral membrane protein
MKNIVNVLLVLAVLVLVVGVASHAARVDVSYVAGTWHRASLLAVAAIVAALLVVVGLLAAVAADLGAGRDRHALEEELQRTYVRLRAAENATAEGAGTASPPAAEPPAGTASPPAAEPPTGRAIPPLAEVPAAQTASPQAPGDGEPMGAS